MGPITEKDVEQIITVIKTLREVVNEYGRDYVYQRRGSTEEGGPECQYVYNGEPDCLAAKVLHRLGVSLATLHSQEGHAANQLQNTGLESAALTVLRAAQTLQDSRHTWGVCLDGAERVALVAYGIEVPQ